MIGIAGAKGSEDNSLVWDMLRALKREASQEIGVRSDGDLHIGAQQSGIVDAACGLACGRNAHRLSIAFTGEIYNLRELVNEFRSNQHVLSTESETEVILHLYHKYAEGCVDHLRGKFAFAIADGQRLFLARDRLGMKPLYYTLLRDRRLFLFASEIKALLRCNEIIAALDMQTIADNLILSYPVGKRTFLENIHNVLPGSTMMIGNERGLIDIEKKQYYCPSLHPDETYTIDRAQERLGPFLDAAVTSHLAGDANIGLTLSGGLDSALLALLMKQHQPHGMQVFTLTDENASADLEQASQLAAKLEAKHDVVYISFEDFLRVIPGCIAADEQPSVLTTLPLHFLCQRLKQKVGFFLSGAGADGLFGGSMAYADRFNATRWLRKRMQVAGQLGMLPSLEVNAIVETILSDVDQDTYIKNVFEINLRDQLTRNHLEIMDKHSTAAGVECRLPYFDYDLVEFANTLPIRFKIDISQGIEKYILKRFVLENYGMDLFDIVVRRKLGFPMASGLYSRWLNKFCQDAVPPEYKERHHLGRCFVDSFGLVLFDMFCEVFLKYRGFPPAEFDVVEFIRSAR